MNFRNPTRFQVQIEMIFFLFSHRRRHHPHDKKRHLPHTKKNHLGFHLPYASVRCSFGLYVKSNMTILMSSTPIARCMAVFSLNVPLKLRSAPASTKSRAISYLPLDAAHINTDVPLLERQSAIATDSSQKHHNRMGLFHGHKTFTQDRGHLFFDH